MHNASISLKEKRKINVPTEFYFTNILLNFYFLALGPSNIDFPPQFTPEIDIRSFFQFPVPPCNKTWAGVTCLESIRITAAIAAKNNLKLWCIDFVGAYLNSLTKEDIYMKQH